MPCYYSSDSYSSSSDEEQDEANCSRCGRLGHVVQECYARTHVNGSLLSGPVKRQKMDDNTGTNGAGIYVLGDEKGRMYVGKSQDVTNRIEQHLRGEGTQFLQGKVRKLGVTQAGSSIDLESWERNETLALMYKYGVGNVRGWMFTSINLSKEQQEQAFGQICEKYDLCRKCGRNSHFVDKCFARGRANWAV